MSIALNIVSVSFGIEASPPIKSRAPFKQGSVEELGLYIKSAFRGKWFSAYLGAFASKSKPSSVIRVSMIKSMVTTLEIGSVFMVRRVVRVKST